MEYEAEKAAFKNLTEKTGIERLAARGDAWFPIRESRSFYNSLNQYVLEIKRNSDEESDHNFESGKSATVLACAADGRMRRLFSATISYVDGDRMGLVTGDHCSLPIGDDETYGVVLSPDDISYRAMLDALERTLSAKGRLGELRDLIYSHRQASTLTLPAMRFPYLNASQEEAVNRVLCAKDVAIVHGPPGTGKTTTLVEAIYETLRREPQVLVCAQSNMAVDWISEKLIDRGVKVLRIGNPSRVTDKMLSSTYEHRFADHPDYPMLWSIRKTIREMHKAARKRSDQWHDKLDRLKSRATELEVRINADIFSEVNVVAATLVGSGNRLLDGMRFTSLFIDEAAQALEAACWIAIRRAGRVVLAGDHCQLPPTVKCYEAMRQGLGKSLMERIVELHPESVSLLTIQYRMNDAIMQFPNQWFYGGAMKSAPDVKYRGILDYDTPIEWLDTSTLPIGEETDDEGANTLLRESSPESGMGRINKDEALVTLAALQAYIEKIGKERFLEENIDVGLISPYRAQVRYLRHLLKNTPFFKPFRKNISINTVDGFQGQERDVIVLSMVRSNEKGNIGFLRDLRRMNVAMTRARMKLLIIGDAPTLTVHPFYRQLHNSINS